MSSEKRKEIVVILTLYRNLLLLERLRKHNSEDRLNYIKEVFKDNGLDPDSIVDATMRHRQNERYTTEVEFLVTLRLNYMDSETEGFKRIINKLKDSPDICITPNDETLLDFKPNETFGRSCNIQLISMSFGSILQNKFIRHSPCIKAVSATDDPIALFRLDSQRTMELYFLLGNSLHYMELKYKRDIDKKIVVCWDKASTRIYFQLLLVPKVYIAEDGSFQYSIFQTRVSANISPEAYLNAQFDINLTWNRARGFPGCSFQTFGLCTALELKLYDASCSKDRLMSFFKELMERQYTITFGQFETSLWNKYTRRWEDIFAFVDDMDSPFAFNINWALNVLYSKGYIAIDYVENHLFFWTSIKDFAIEDPEQLELALYKVMVILDDDRSIDIYKALIDNYKDRSLKRLVTEIDNIKKIRVCYITPTRQMFFPPMDMLENRILRVYNPDYALRVTYRDDDMTRIKASNTDFYDEIIRAHISNGIKIHDRTFQFLACSNSQLRTHGVWFYAKDPKNYTSQIIRDEAGSFSHIDCIATYVSRLGQCFSTSERAVASIKNLEREEDDIKVLTPKGEYTFSDGTGRVSQSLAEQICTELKKNYKHIPSLFQIRYGGCKGTVSVDNTLQGDVIVIRKSMAKFKCKNDDLEIVKVAGPSRLHLNHQSIMLLEHHGVSKNVFLKLQEKAIDTYLEMLLDEHTAARVLDGRASMNRPLSHKDLLVSGMSLTTEPYFRRVLKLILHNSLGAIKTDGRIDLPTDKGRNLMGCMDEYKVLEYGEVHVKITSMETDARDQKSVITGPVIITKFPAVHPGDMRRFTAVEKPELAHLADCVVFPQQGSRPHPSQMAGSDLDGDEYFVTWLPEFLSAFTEENKEPLDYLAVKKIQLGRPIVVSDIYQFISDYIKNDQLGTMANAHKAIADKHGLDYPIAVKLAEKFSVAVDFAKTGECPTLEKQEQVTEYPDFMEKHVVSSVYESDKALGHMYRSVALLDDLLEQSLDTKDDGVNWEQIKCGEPNEKYLAGAKRIYSTYCSEVRELMNLYGVSTETELISGNVTEFHRRFMEKEDLFATKHIVERRVVHLRREYRATFFEEFHINIHVTTTFKITDEMKDKAYAWYFVAYCLSTDDANNVDKSDRILSFPWLVSDVLCRIRSCQVRNSSPCIDEMNQSLLNMYAQHLTANADRIRQPTNEALLYLAGKCPVIYPLLYIIDEWCRAVNLRDMFLSVVEVLLRQLDITGVDISRTLLDGISTYSYHLVECSGDEVGTYSIGQVLMNLMKKVGSQDFLRFRDPNAIMPFKDRQSKERLGIHAMRANFSLAVDNTCQTLLIKEIKKRKMTYVMKEATVIMPRDYLNYMLLPEVSANIKANFERLAAKIDLYLHELSITRRKNRKKTTGTLFFRGSFKAVNILRRVAIKWFKTFEVTEDNDYYIELYKIFSEIRY